jgi:hypothetical protein
MAPEVRREERRDSAEREQQLAEPPGLAFGAWGEQVEGNGVEHALRVPNGLERMGRALERAPHVLDPSGLAVAPVLEIDSRRHTGIRSPGSRLCDPGC